MGSPLVLLPAALIALSLPALATAELHLIDNPSQAQVLVGAGDIATCGSPGAEETAQLLDQIEGIVFTSGDNAYEEGKTQECVSCYEPTWGCHKERTRPAPSMRARAFGSLSWGRGGKACTALAQFGHTAKCETTRPLGS